MGRAPPEQPGTGRAAPHALRGRDILRRASRRGAVSDDIARLAHADLLDLEVELVGYEPLAARTWALRGSVTVCDAANVALAEGLAVPLATLDHRLTRASGPRCAFRTPPAAD